MVRVATFRLYKSLRDSRVQLPCACCLLQTALRVVSICHLPWSPRMPAVSLATSCRSTAIPRLPHWPAALSSSVSAGMATGLTAGCPSASQQAVTPRIWALTLLQPQKQVWRWAGFTSSNTWVEAWLHQSPLLSATQPTQVSLRPSQLDLQIAMQASQWQISLRAFTLPSAFARSSRACEMQMLSHLRVLFNQPQMLRLIEQWFA